LDVELLEGLLYLRPRLGRVSPGAREAFAAGGVDLRRPEDRVSNAERAGNLPRHLFRRAVPWRRVEHAPSVVDECPQHLAERARVLGTCHAREGRGAAE